MSHLVKFSQLKSYERAVLLLTYGNKKAMKKAFFAKAKSHLPLQEGFSMRRSNLHSECVHSSGRVITPVVNVTHSGVQLRFMISSEPTERNISMESPVDVQIGNLIYQYVPDENFSEDMLQAAKARAYITARFYQLLFS